MPTFTISYCAPFWSRKSLDGNTIQGEGMNSGQIFETVADTLGAALLAFARERHIPDSEIGINTSKYPLSAEDVATLTEAGYPIATDGFPKYGIQIERIDQGR